MSKRKKKSSDYKWIIYLVFLPVTLVYFLCKLLYKYKAARIFTIFTVGVLSISYTLTYIADEIGLLERFNSSFEESMENLFLIISCLLIVFLLYKRNHIKYSIEKLDAMNGHDFEYACADILRANGFRHVEVTKGSGDFGVDIIAYKRSDKYAVQCKRYSSTLGNSPIQEVTAGKIHYHCNRAAVMTNSTFTSGANLLAAENGVELWDRDILIKMLQKKPKRKKSNKNTVTKSENIINDNSFEELPAAVTPHEESLRNTALEKFLDASIPEHLKPKYSKRTVEFAETASTKAELEEYPEVLTDYINGMVTNIITKFWGNDVLMKFDNCEFLWGSNEVILKFTLEEEISHSEFLECVKQIPQMTNYPYAEYVSLISDRKLVGIKLPLPEYMKKINQIIAEQ